MMASARSTPSCASRCAQICERYPRRLWRKLEAGQAYPTEFITELTQGGFPRLADPEEYGGSGLPLRAAAVILEEIMLRAAPPAKAMPRCTSWAPSAARQREQKQRYLPKIASGECPAGFRGDRADHRLRHDKAQDSPRVRQGKPFTS